MPDDWHLESVNAGGRDASTEAIALDRDLSSVTIVFSDAPCRVSGAVASLPVGETAEVFMVPVDRRLWTDYGRHPRHLLHQVVRGDGAFSFVGFPPGEYAIAALQDEPSREWQDPTLWTRVIQIGERLVLSSGEQRLTRLERPARAIPASVARVELASFSSGHVNVGRQQPRDVVSSRPPEVSVGLSLLGRVRSPDGRPVTKALVRLSGDAIEVDRITVTDAEGRYQFTELPEGHYSLSAEKPGFLRSWFGASLPGRGPGVPLHLPTLAPADIDLVRGGTVSGTVRGVGGRAATGAIVKALRIEQGPNGPVLAEVSGHSADDADDLGAFRLYGLPVGDYVVVATANARMAELTKTLSVAGQVAARSVTLGPAFFPSAVSPGAAEVVRLANGQDRIDVDVALSVVSAGRLAGHVVAARDGRRLGNVRVTLRSAGSGPSVVAASAIAGTDGSFDLGNVPPGVYELIGESASQGIGSAGTLATIRSWGRLALSTDGSEQTQLELTLQPARSIRGTVRLDGEPLPIDLVKLVRIRLKLIDREPAVVLSAAPTADGAFALDQVMPGTYSVTAFFLPPADSQVTLSAVAFGDLDVLRQPLAFGEGAVSNLAVTLTARPSQLDGRVTDENGRPSHGVAVFAVAVDRSRRFRDSLAVQRGRTSENGDFRIIGLPDGDYAVCAEAGIGEGRWPTVDELEEIAETGMRVHVEAGQTVRVALTISPRSRAG